MALYASTQANAVKRQKTGLRDTSTRSNVVDSNEYFQGIQKIEYKPEAGIEETLCYRYYNAVERVHGRTMEEWLRPSISFWHAFNTSPQHDFDSWNQSLLQRPWDDGNHTLETYKRRIRAAFEFYSKLGVKYWCVWDRDLAPEGDTLEETNHNMDEIMEFILDLQQKTGTRLLWLAVNLHYNPRYNSGACTSSDASVLSFAGAQVKKAMEVAHKLGAESFLFRGIKEGFSSHLTTDHTKQLRGFARLLKMTSDYRDRIGYRGQLLLEPNYENFFNYRKNDKYLNSSKVYHYYDYDTTSALCFLKHFNLDRYYKISAKIGHQLSLASIYGSLGSIDATCITAPPNIHETTLLLKTVIENGGIQPGGLNIGVTMYPDSTDLKDMALAYISAIDSFAKGLRNAAKIIADGILSKNVQQRYLSYHSGFGSRFMNGEASLEECEEQAHKHNNEVFNTSSRTEHWETVFARYSEKLK
uniref:Xylose isomerase n=1 Tax=Clastoptera arizonana TaxID=38151 RepID=A0A1B6E4W0_9HEMI